MEWFKKLEEQLLILEDWQQPNQSSVVKLSLTVNLSHTILVPSEVIGPLLVVIANRLNCQLPSLFF
jgi:hypothetical protein